MLSIGQYAGRRVGTVEKGTMAYIACDRSVRVRLMLRWSGRRALITHSSSSQLVCGVAASRTGDLPMCSTAP